MPQGKSFEQSQRGRMKGSTGELRDIYKEREPGQGLRHPSSSVCRQEMGLLETSHGIKDPLPASSPGLHCQGGWELHLEISTIHRRLSQALHTCHLCSGGEGKKIDMRSRLAWAIVSSKITWVIEQDLV